MTTYFYQVEEFVTDMQGNSFDCAEDFHNPKLLDAREDALAYYTKRLIGLHEKGQVWGKEFRAPDSFKIGQHAAYSITMFLVEVTDGEETHYPIMGGTADEMEEAHEVEEIVIHGIYGVPEGD